MNKFIKLTEIRGGVSAIIAINVNHIVALYEANGKYTHICTTSSHIYNSVIVVKECMKDVLTLIEN